MATCTEAVHMAGDESQQTPCRGPLWQALEFNVSSV